jgi:hypothetical protein
MENKEDREGTTPAGTRLLIRSSPDRGSVLLHRDQHFIERESYHSGRERTLEIQGRSWYVTCVISPMCCAMTNKAPGPCRQLSLPPGGSRTHARVERESATFISRSPDLERRGLSARDCLRDSQAICYFQESLRTIIINKDIDNKDRNHLQRTGEVS